MCSAQILELYALLDSLTPLNFDCGRLCSGACCKGDEHTGMLLFPGEEELIPPMPGCRVEDYDPKTIAGARLFVCSAHCAREHRPLACRLFPLCYDTQSQRLCMDPRGRAVCPLTHKDIKALSPAFVKACAEVYSRVMADEQGAAFLALVWEQCREHQEFSL